MRKDEANEKIKTRLGQYLVLREECANMREKIQNKQEEIDWLKGLMSERFRLNGDTRIQAQQAAELMERMVGYYAKLAARREEAERRILNTLDHVENCQGRHILYLHYIEGLDFNDIPVEMQISSRNMWYKYNAALNELCVLWEEKGDIFGENTNSSKDFMR